MNIGFLRSSASLDDLQEEMSGLEDAGCERIVVDNALATSPHAGMLRAIINRLTDGDALTVWSLDSIADSMPELVELLLQLEARNIRFRALKEGFDSYGRNRTILRATFQKLNEFGQQLELRHQREAKANQAHRVGRPRALSSEDIERAQRLVNDGWRMDAVAKEFHVSRATLYRYLDEHGSVSRGKL